jgi:hypothetical protein
MIGKGDHVYTIPFYGVARPQLMDLIFKDEVSVYVGLYCQRNFPSRGVG